MIVIGLGANMPSKCGAPAATLRAALMRLETLGLRIEAVSSFYRTPAWPDPADPPFVNAVAAVQTRLQPMELLNLLHQVETEYGRVRSTPNSPRTLDLDLIDYGGLVMCGAVNLPHPRMAQRSFVLVPLAQIAPGWHHPETGEGVAVLLERLPDREVPIAFV